MAAPAFARGPQEDPASVAAAAAIAAQANRKRTQESSPDSCFDM
jgi:hypothetical protein